MTDADRRLSFSVEERGILFVPPGVHQTAQLYQGACPKFLYGIGSASHHAGHLGQRFAFQFAQHQHFAIVDWQLAQGVGQDDRALTAAVRFGWARNRTLPGLG